MKSIIKAILLAAFIATAPARADDTFVATVEDAWEAAVTQYSQGRHAEAFANFFWAAIRDHAQAQEIVGMMYLLGPETYGPGVRRDVQEAAFWLAQAASRGREPARYVHCLMGLGNEQKSLSRAALEAACAAGRNRRK